MTETRQLVHAPEFPQGLTWFNTAQPLALKELRGKIVVLDFWTYCCINCMHVLPDLRYLEEKFASAPFQVIGVHCPKFPNEKVDHHVRHAIMRYGIAHPVVVDSGFQIWQRFAVRAWPTLVVVDPLGYVVGHLPGEGHRGQLEEYLVNALPHYRAEGAVKEGGAPLLVERPEPAQARAELSYPGKVAADPQAGTLWVSDTGHHRLLEVRPDRSRPEAAIVRRIGSGQPGLKDGPAAEAAFRDPQGMTVQGPWLYVADTNNHSIRAVERATGVVRTLAGTGTQATHGARGGPGKSVPLNSPWDVVCSAGVLYIAMAGPHQLWRLNLDAGQVEVHAGSGREEILDGPLAEAALAQPSGITLFDGGLAFADSEVSSLRWAPLDGAAGDGKGPPGKDGSDNNTVRTLIGGGLFVFGDKDGALGEALLQHPLGVAGHDGRLYVADTYNHKIKVYDPRSRQLRTLAGDGTAGSNDGALARARFHEPGGLAWLDGLIYVADTNNHLLRRIDPAGAVETLSLR